ncbi:MAG: helix-turn-helix domain-containing protein [Reyranella sp.]|uniref:helix-turn-helix domain-containing protein n=1 Tax=Reyranella sp. TaxID=1929291 RepID=UPI001AD4B166|nr:helix-turn-helix domain-containing protein [Reyranella sp.]MBN9085693.1 helix-turn-helix domain-containing protein [Reyranella sp.]
MTIAASDSQAAKPRILVVEGNYLIAKTVCDILQDCGFAIAGAVGRVESGLELLAKRDIDGAIVDISLNGCQSFPLCAELTRRKVPFCFLMENGSGAAIPPAFRGTPLVTKPVEASQVKSALTALVQPGPVRGNLLLQRLGDEDWAFFESCLERVPLHAGDVLETMAEPARYVVFPVSGVISLAAQVADRRIEVGLVGREGLVGAMALLDGDIAAGEASVLFPGEAWRVPAPALASLLENRRLRAHLLHYVHALMSQISANALATGRATIEQRLARWLLMAADRLEVNEVAVTHEALAQALGVRRAGVTVAMHALEGRQALRSERRRVRLLDRPQLEAAAGGFYGLAEDLYDRLVVNR